MLVGVSVDTAKSPIEMYDIYAERRRMTNRPHFWQYRALSQARLLPRLAPMTPLQKRSIPLSDGSCYHELGHLLRSLCIGSMRH